MNNDFAVRLKRAMFLRNIKQAELAKKTGINKGDLSHYMRGDYTPGAQKLKLLAEGLGVTSDWLLGKEEMNEAGLTMPKTVPVLGKVAAGSPLYATEDIIGFIASDEDDVFALQIKGDSMSPRILDGDVVLVKKTDIAEDGDLIIALIGDDATCKVLKKTSWGITLVPFNPAFAPLVYVGEETEQIKILGKVIESRHEWH